MQTLTACNAKVVSTRTAVRQFKGLSSRGRWRTCQGRFKMQTRTDWGAKITSTRTAVGQFKGQFNGAMEKMSGKVQNANTHPLQCQSREHAHSSRSVQGPQFKGQWNVTQGSIRRKTHVALPRHTTNSEHTIGALDESSRNVQNVSAHSVTLRTNKAAYSQFNGALVERFR